MMEQDVKAQHTPSDAAIQYACKLANAQEPKSGMVWTKEDMHCGTLRALALYIDEVDRVARECMAATDGNHFASLIRSLMLPDQPDPDEELAREMAEQFATIYPHAAEEVALATIKRLREQGRLTDAK